MISENLRSKTFQFQTKPGLFSKDKIDAGSKLLVNEMDIKPSDIILDLGCGYGAIGLVAASLAFKGKVYMLDTDIRAIKYSTMNAKINNIKNVEIIASDGFEKVPNIKFTLVVSNPPSHLPKETLIEFIEGSKKQLVSGGKLLFVNEKRIVPLIEREFTRVFGNYSEIAKKGVYKLSCAINK